MIYSKQRVFCQICGKEMDIEVANAPWDSGRTCSQECWHEWEWRRTLSIMNKSYYPCPPKA